MNFTPPQIFLRQKKINTISDRRGLVARTTDDRHIFIYQALAVKTEGSAKLAKSSLRVTVTADLSLKKTG